jgi:phage baseplate assembly protein W
MAVRMKDNATWRGFTFPPKPGASEILKIEKDIDLVKASITTILGTGVRSRAMRPTFGGGLQEMIFENAMPPGSVISMFRSRILNTLRVEEPRVLVTDIGLAIKKHANDMIYVDITVFFDYAGIEDSTLVKLDL